MTPDPAIPRTCRPRRPWLAPLILVLVVLALAGIGFWSLVMLAIGACR